MFAVLQTKPPEGLHLLRRKPELVAMRREDPPGGAPFFVLTATTQKHDALPWLAIEAAAGRLRTKMLLPAGIEPPCPEPPQTPLVAPLFPEPGVRAFVPRRLPMLLCLRLAQKVLHFALTPPQRLRVTLVDSAGQFAYLLDGLAPLAADLRVFTLKPTAYRSIAQQLLHRYGLTLVVSDSPACFLHSHVVIADNLQPFCGRERGLVFTPDTTALPGCRVVRCSAPVLPAPFAALLPPQGIAPLLFASALHELCGVKEMERFAFERLGFDNNSQDYSCERLAELLDESSKVPTA